MHHDKLSQDVGMMREMGLKAYRFSLAWSRIQPSGTGLPNEAGLGFYDRLVDELLAANIEPMCTLYHWDLPSALQAQGGWENRDIVAHFAHYTRTVAQRLGDRVKLWATFNEPQIFVPLGLQFGKHAPGLKLPIKNVLQASHNVLLAHGQAVQVLREHAPNAQVGIVMQTPVGFPSTDSPADIEAARQFTFGLAPVGQFVAQALGAPVVNPVNTGWWCDAVFLGKYPDEGASWYGDAMPTVEPGDMALIAQPLDFCGVNLYFGVEISAENGTSTIVPRQTGCPITGMEWPVTPKALQWAARYLFDRYKTPIYITENGLALRDWVSLDGRVHDPQRIDFTTRYLRELAKAVAAGADVRGYFHWSLMDNFEWSEGYKHRFGLVHVDFTTGERTVKESGKWYRELIASNGAGL